MALQTNIKVLAPNQPSFELNQSNFVIVPTQNRAGQPKSQRMCIINPSHADLTGSTFGLDFRAPVMYLVLQVRGQLVADWFADLDHTSHKWRTTARV